MPMMTMSTNSSPVLPKRPLDMLWDPPQWISDYSSSQIAAWMRIHCPWGMVFMWVHFNSLVAVRRLVRVSLGSLSGFCFCAWPIRFGMESPQLLSSSSQALTALNSPLPGWLGQDNAERGAFLTVQITSYCRVPWAWFGLRWCSLFLRLQRSAKCICCCAMPKPCPSNCMY